MAIQEREQHRTFGFAQSHNVRREQRIDIDDLFCGFWMHADERMSYRRIVCNRSGKSLGATGFGEALGEAMAKVMDGVELIEHPPDRR